MPTGYTSQIKEGITFQEFAMGCARAFGACIMMRDDSVDKPIPEKFKPSMYHKEELYKVCQKLRRIDSLSTDEGEKEAIAKFTKETQQRRQAIEEDCRLMKQYKDMLREVKKWQPPTSDHAEFKKFMISQIESSIEFDGMGNYYTEHPIRKLTREEWLAEKKKEALRDINYHTKEFSAERERINQRNKWIKDLRDSLKTMK